MRIFFVIFDQHNIHDILIKAFIYFQKAIREDKLTIPVCHRKDPNPNPIPMHNHNPNPMIFAMTELCDSGPPPNLLDTMETQWTQSSLRHLL